jgi:trehalose-6-phosphatase
MQESSFNYEVQMKRAETGVEAANLALQEVKDVVKVMSTGKSKGSVMDKISTKISSWF